MAGKRQDATRKKARTAGQSATAMDGRSAGKDTDKNRDMEGETLDPGEALTTNQGVAVGDDQNSLKAGARGPTLLEDIHFREKMTHFDNERIPERVVHARGAAAHGVFQVYEDLSDLTMASLFRDPSRETPVFVRFSTVVGSRGSPDTPRDVRGFAVKFFTETGVWDLVGNNMPVFFIQDAVKFPDLVHAIKPEPHNEIPQAQAAHDTFWDFASLTPESAHMLMWVMSDRAFPRSYATMEGFGVHTFRFINEDGVARFVKFHWKPVKGLASLVADEAQKVAGKDPDFNRRDLYESIERGDFPEFELGVQVVEEQDEHSFGFDLLDPTKIIPEEVVPVRPIGRMTLTRNPDNFFAETEQSAFHPGHVVPGIDFTNDPLLQGRLFSYIDTQLRRVGPNFHELPINRPLNEVRNNQRDGFARIAINQGRVAYFPNSLGGGCPMHSPERADALRGYTERVDGQKVRERSASFSDHFSQATQFWNSMAEWEKRHIAEGFAFELNQVETEAVRSRTMNEILVNIHEDLAERVSLQTGIPVEPAGTPEDPTPSAPTPAGPLRPEAKELSSPALSMDRPGATIRGKRVALIVDTGFEAKEITPIQDALTGEGALPEIVALRAGTVADAKGKAHKVQRAAPNAPSVIYDALIFIGGAPGNPPPDLALVALKEAFLHGKPVAALKDHKHVLEFAGIDAPEEQEGVLTGSGKAIAADIVTTLLRRYHDRGQTWESPRRAAGAPPPT